MKDVKFEERELAEIFQVEELEKRYEMGWGGSSTTASCEVSSDGTINSSIGNSTGSVGFSVNPGSGQYAVKVSYNF